ncbi:hypothetical protein T439DRAFT_380654 [Meredithblackwellia eburnea MCA 4105]
MGDSNNVRVLESSGRTNKRELISQLAAELTKTKQKAKLLSSELDKIDDKLDEQYKKQEQEELKWQGERDKNNHTIHALRREIARCSGELEAAAVIDEAEAERYLELLRDTRKPSSQRPEPKTPSLDETLQARKSAAVAPTSESLVDPPLSHPLPLKPKSTGQHATTRSVTRQSSSTAAIVPTTGTSSSTKVPRVISGLSDKPFGQKGDPLGQHDLSLTGTARDRQAQRLRRVESLLDQKPTTIAPTIPPPPKTLTFRESDLPTLMDKGNALSGSAGLSGVFKVKTPAQLEAEERRRAQLADEALKQQKKALAQSGSGSESRSKNFVSKVFPGLGHKRRSSRKKSPITPGSASSSSSSEEELVYPRSLQRQPSSQAGLSTSEAPVRPPLQHQQKSYPPPSRSAGISSKIGQYQDTSAVASTTSFKSCISSSSAQVQLVGGAATPTQDSGAEASSHHFPTPPPRSPKEASTIVNPVSSSLAALFTMPTTRLRRTSSVDHLPSGFTPTLPTTNPKASASTTNVATTISGGGDSKSKSNSNNTAYDRNKVIGPKSGAKLLATEEAQRAIEQADRLSSNLSINSGVIGSIDDSSSSPTPTPVKRVPVPAVETPPSKKESTKLVVNGSSPSPGKKEGNLKELTRRASAEDVAIKANGNSKEARKRLDSLTKGFAAGLGSPFGGTKKTDTSASGAAAVVVGKKEKDPEISRHPPVSGIGGMRRRTRSDASSGSNASTSKDLILSQLAEALRKERKRCELYESEILSIEEEMDEVEASMSAQKEKYNAIIAEQEQTIINLRAELAELERDLLTAHDLDDEEAAKYLALLGTATPRTTDGSISPEVKSKTGSKIFELGLGASALRSTETIQAVESGADKPKSKSARRIDSRLAGNPDAPITTKFFHRRPRKLSKTQKDTPISLASKNDDGMPTATSRAASPTNPVSTIKIRRMADDEPIPKSVSHPPLSGLNRPGILRRNSTSDQAAKAPANQTNSSTAQATQGHKRKGSLTRTLRGLFPNSSTTDLAKTTTFPPNEEVERAESIHRWLRMSDLASQGARNPYVGPGYGNPFVKA